MKSTSSTERVRRSAEVPAEIPAAAGPWIYGWTHHGMAGQTQARMNKRSLEVQIRELDRWVSCDAVARQFFKPAALCKKP